MDRRELSFYPFPNTIRFYPFPNTVGSEIVQHFKWLHKNAAGRFIIQQMSTPHPLPFQEVVSCVVRGARQGQAEITPSMEALRRQRCQRQERVRDYTSSKRRLRGA